MRMRAIWKLIISKYENDNPFKFKSNEKIKYLQLIKIFNIFYKISKSNKFIKVFLQGIQALLRNWMF